MKLITAFSMSFGMFCAIPFPVRRWDEKLRPLMIVCFPWVGAVIGLIWGLCAWVMQLVEFTGPVAAGLLTAVPLLLTGFIHMDGFMDCCDAIYSRRDLETRLKILKDSHCGAFAVLHVAMYLLLFFAAMTQAAQMPWILAFLPVATRCVSGLSVATLRPLSSSQYAGPDAAGYRTGHFAALILTLLASMAVPVVLFGLPGLCVALTAAVTFLNVRIGVHQLGGMSGDISGFAVTRGELAGVLALAILIWLEGVL